jgi:hypothetical protein
MQPSDLLFALAIAIILYLSDSDSGGGRHGRLPVAVRA